MGIKILQTSFFIFFLVTFSLFFLRNLGNDNPLIAFDAKALQYNHKEEFDASLMRLNTLHKLKEYCDSLFQIKNKVNNPAKYESDYAGIVENIVRKRFYWGYSCYSFNNNYMAVLFSKITQWGYAATVIPDDILKYPNAACSQQSIIIMEVLKKKGISTRKIGFYGNNKIGHFAFEAYYNNSWHFYDPSLEPDTVLLNKYDRPGIQFIAAYPEVLFAAYRKTHKDKIFLWDIFSHYRYGQANCFPAPNALLFHQFTKILSDTLWIFFLTGYILIKSMRQRKRRQAGPC